MRALLRTLVQVANKRDDPFSKNARLFLEGTTPLDWVLLAMCADASDELLLLIRFHDDESAEVACIGQKVSECITNLHNLFGEKQCLERMCFTRYILNSLKKPMVLAVRGKDKCGSTIYSKRFAHPAGPNLQACSLEVWCMHASVGVLVRSGGYCGLH